MLSSTIRFHGALSACCCSRLRVTPPPVIPASGDYRSLQDYLDWYIPRQLQKYDVPGLSIALVDGSRLVWAKGYGYADAERAVPADAETVYQVGSVSKILTAVAALGLAERGRIDLDKPITRYLPEFAIKSRWPAADPITLRTLLTHHAGLPTFYLKGFFSHQPLSGVIQELRSEYLAYPPGTTLSYSNIGTNLTGLAIERVSGREFAAYMREEVFRPLAMTHSGFAPTTASPPSSRAAI